MTPEQHQIERMRAWVAFYCMGKQGYASVNADKALEAFDARFPAPKEAPKEPDWTPHTPGDPMPCDGETLVDVILRDGDIRYARYAKYFDWGHINKVGSEIIRWRPAA